MGKSEDLARDRKPAPLGVTRRHILPLVGATAASAVILPHSLAAAPPDPSEKPSSATARFVYVGTYTAPGVPPGGTHPSTAVGIYVFKLRPSDGDLTLLQIVPAMNPSYLALYPSLKHLYSVNEMTDGHVSAYALDQANGKLSFLNSMSANGKDTTHLSVQLSGQYLFAAN
jgi:hypothetical protein